MDKITRSACSVTIISSQVPALFTTTQARLATMGFLVVIRPSHPVAMVTALVRCQEWLAVLLDTPSYNFCSSSFWNTFLVCSFPSLHPSFLPSLSHPLPPNILLFLLFLPSFIPSSSLHLPFFPSPSSSLSPSPPYLYTNNSCDHHVTIMWSLPILQHATCHEQLILHNLHDLITCLGAALRRTDYGDGLQHKCRKEGKRECV